MCIAFRDVASSGPSAAEVSRDRSEPVDINTKLPANKTARIHGFVTAEIPPKLCDWSLYIFGKKMAFTPKQRLLCGVHVITWQRNHNLWQRANVVGFSHVTPVLVSRATVHRCSHISISVDLLGMDRVVGTPSWWGPWPPAQTPQMWICRPHPWRQNCQWSKISNTSAISHLAVALFPQRPYSAEFHACGHKLRSFTTLTLKQRTRVFAGKRGA